MGTTHSVTYDMHTSEDPINPFVVDRFFLRGYNSVLLMYPQNLEEPDLKFQHESINHIFNLIAETSITGQSYPGIIDLLHITFDSARDYIYDTDYVKYWLYKDTFGNGNYQRLGNEMRILTHAFYGKKMLISEDETLLGVSGTTFALVQLQPSYPYAFNV